MMMSGAVLGMGVCAMTLFSAPTAWPLVLPFGTLWLLAPLVAYWTSRPRYLSKQMTCSAREAVELRLIARKTWRYFETFVTDLDNQLPPDNFQEVPIEVIAHRTSPTNMGLYLLSTLAANDFGWAGREAVIKRLEATLEVMQHLPRFKGHFFNWYDTQRLLTLEPAYVSSVDSGNLAGHLLVVASTCENWQQAADNTSIRSGLQDTYLLMLQALQAYPVKNSKPVNALTACLKAIRSQLYDEQPVTSQLAELERLAQQGVETAHRIDLQAHPKGPSLSSGQRPSGRRWPNIAWMTPASPIRLRHGCRHWPNAHAPWPWEWTSHSCWIGAPAALHRVFPLRQPARQQLL